MINANAQQKQFDIGKTSLIKEKQRSSVSRVHAKGFYSSKSKALFFEVLLYNICRKILQLKWW